MLKAKGAVSLVRLVAVMIGMTVAIVGCHKVTGGGWVAGLYGGKANFGFQARCVAGTGDQKEFSFYEGQFQFQDRSAGVRFHGDIDPGFTAGWENNCEDASVPLGPVDEALFSGTCVSQPGGIVGSFSVQVVDNGSPGSFAGDTIIIDTPSTSFFYQGEYSGIACSDNGVEYHNAGAIGGGNIVSHGHK